LKSSEEQTFDAIVIGSGVGGMAAARMLAEFGGKRVLVLEQHYTPGGMTHEFSRGSYHFGTGVHYLGISDQSGEPGRFLRYLSDGRLQWQRLPADFDILHFPGLDFAVPSSETQFIDRLKEMFPSEAKAIDDYFLVVRKAAKGMISRHVVTSFPSAIRAVAMPIVGALFPESFRLLHDEIARNLRDPKLRAILSARWGLYGRPPSESAFGFHALIPMDSYIDGAIYPVGGPREVGQAMLDSLERYGVVLRVRQRVNRVIVEKGRAAGLEVTDQVTGQSYRVHANCIVSAIGIRNTCRLVDAAHARPIQRELAKLPKELAAVLLFVGFHRSPTTLGLQGENHWLMPDLDDEIGFMRPLGEGILYASFGSLNNPAAREHIAEVIQMIDLEAFRDELVEPEKYQRFKKGITERILDRLDQRWPGFKENVAFTELATPSTFEKYQGSVGGSFYGLSAGPERLRSSVARCYTPVKGLFLAGQDACGPGVEAALMGGILAANAVISGPQKLKMWRALRSGSIPNALPWRGYMRVAKIERLTPSVKRFRLEPLDGRELPFTFKGGQYLMLDLPIAGERVPRAYSISSSPANVRYLEVTVKREPYGLGSGFLHQDLEVGQALRLSGPFGEFTCDTRRELGAGKLLLISGGVGITPMMSLLSAAADAGHNGSVTLLAAFRSEDEVLFSDEIEVLKRRLPSLDTSVFVTQPGSAWTGFRGRIDQDSLRPHLQNVARVHLCGPSSMMQATIDLLTDLQVPREVIRTEAFVSAQSRASRIERAHANEAAARQGGAEHYKIALSGGETFVCLPGQTVLAAANTAQVSLPRSCGEGVCGTCRVRVLSGLCDPGAPGTLSRDEVEGGWVLACQTFAKSDLEITV